MNRASKTLALLLLLGAFRLEAQVAVTPGPMTGLGSLAVSQQAPNTLVLGSMTSVSYDSNALNSRPPTPNVEYNIYPQIGLNLARPKWDALISFVPGFSYSSASLPQYQAVSLTSSVSLRFVPSERLSLNFANSFVSSSNPFSSLPVSSGVGSAGSGGAVTGAGTALNYLPATNEFASADAAYNLNARTSLTALATYNYISYRHDPDIPDAAQPFQESKSTRVTFGLRRNSSPRYQGSVLCSAQFIDAGQGLTKTVGQSVQYSMQYSVKPNLLISAMIGPEYIQNNYSRVLGTRVGANLANQLASGWLWTGSAGLTWTEGKNVFSASVSRSPSLGNQYQGNVGQTSINANIRRPLAGKTDLDFFGGYSINAPLVIAQSVPRLSNNYLSAGAMVSKTFAQNWALIAYWYLLQNTPQVVGQLYSGNHNRVAVSLSYSLAKPLTK